MLIVQDFRIADTFTSSLARLTADEQKAAKATAFELQRDRANSGISFHEIDAAHDKNFWFVKVSAEIRLIVHRSPGCLLLCYVGHGHQAHDWARRRKLEAHPKTGAAQLVEIRGTVKEVMVPGRAPVELPAGPRPLVFADRSDEELFGYGVPAEWLADVKAATGETLLVLADHLPAEAAEALLQLAAGGKPRVLQIARQPANPFNHPDAQRRFRVMTNGEELERALDFPLEKWMVFLHPEQRGWVERAFDGPARVCGSAGTGKTIVAVHRAVHLARTRAGARILLTTFSDTLANGLRTKLGRLLSKEPRLAERIEVLSINAIGLRLYRARVGSGTMVSPEVLRELVRQAAGVEDTHKFGLRFLLTEWTEVVDAWQLGSWEVYREVARLGKNTRLTEERRAALWSIFERVRAALRARNLITHAELFTVLATAIENQRKVDFDFAVVDEAQDLSVAHLKFIAALGGGRADALFFAGDLGQRIAAQPFSWKALGVDVRGRSRVLRVNYRNSHQIRARADCLPGPALTDVDGNSEKRNDTVSVGNGPPPAIYSLKSQMEERKTVGGWIAERARAGVAPHEFGVFVRSAAQLDRARAAVKEAKMAFAILGEHVETTSGHVSICTMHLAKGLEFRAVAVMACDHEIIPWQERVEAAPDDADLKEVHDTERHLFYVACTRAREHLLVTCVAPGSEFLEG